jgi:hypothetical protein
VPARLACRQDAAGLQHLYGVHIRTHLQRPSNASLSIHINNTRGHPRRLMNKSNDVPPPRRRPLFAHPEPKENASESCDACLRLWTTKGLQFHRPVSNAARGLCWPPLVEPSRKLSARGYLLEARHRVSRKHEWRAPALTTAKVTASPIGHWLIRGRRALGAAS